MMDWVYSGLGLLILLLAGDSLVKGAVNLSLRLGVPALIVSLTIVGDDSDDAIAFDVPGTPGADEVRRLMLTSGLWPSLRARPFGHVPDPQAEPRALLVTAIDSEPLAPDPARVIAAQAQAFARGLDALFEVFTSAEEARDSFAAEDSTAGIP